MSMQSKIDGSPVQIFKLAAQAAPNGGVIAMRERDVVGTAVKEGDKWSVRVYGRNIAELEGNSTVAAAFLHAFFMGENFKNTGVDTE